MTCAVEGCGKEIQAGKIMCVPHWSAVPLELKRHIWVMYETGYRRGTTPWLAAVTDAARAARMALPPAAA